MLLVHDARIKATRIAVAHDGVAELIVCIEYDNGSTSEITLDAIAGEALMGFCGATALEELEGHSWERVKEALGASYNRFQ